MYCAVCIRTYSSYAEATVTRTTPLLTLKTLPCAFRHLRISLSPKIYLASTFTYNIGISLSTVLSSTAARLLIWVFLPLTVKKNGMYGHLRRRRSTGQASNCREIDVPICICLRNSMVRKHLIYQFELQSP